MADNKINIIIVLVIGLSVLLSGCGDKLWGER